MNEAMMKPVLSFQRTLLILIFGWITASNAVAAPVWQPPQKTETPDPYFNPRKNSGEDSDVVRNSTPVNSPGSLTGWPAVSKPALSTQIKAVAAKANQSVWEPPRTPVIAASALADKPNPQLSPDAAIPHSKYPLEPAGPIGLAPRNALQTGANSQTIIREHLDSPKEIVSDDFSAEIIGRPPASRLAIESTDSQAFTTGDGGFSPGNLDSPADKQDETNPQINSAQNSSPSKTPDGFAVQSPRNYDKPISSTTGGLKVAEDSKVTDSPNVETFEPTQLLAMVGSEPIFVGDVLFEVNQMIERFMGNAPESVKEAERKKIVPKILPKFVDSKLLYIGTLEMLPEEADVDKILEQAGEEFDEKALPRMIESAGLKTANEFDAQLRAQGSSLRKMRLSWSQEQLTKYFLSQQLKSDSEVTHQEMLDNYRSRLAEYELPAKSKWEQVMIRFDRVGSREEARKQIVELGNQIVYGANLSAIAKKSSHGFRAANGGQHDWTSKGALVLKELDEAIFSLPVGELSEIIETPDGFHLVRVLERTEQSRKPFLEAQVDIKEQLLEERTNCRVQETPGNATRQDPGRIL